MEEATCVMWVHLQKNCYGGVFGDNSGIFFSYFSLKTYVVSIH